MICIAALETPSLARRIARLFIIALTFSDAATTRRWPRDDDADPWVTCRHREPFVGVPEGATAAISFELKAHRKECHLRFPLQKN